VDDSLSGPVLRLMDANANRAREAMRVIEDYARFVLDDGELYAALKHVRHELAQAVGPWVAQAIFWRDTLGDTGTDHKTASEQNRADMAAVVTAAGKRLGEALRSLEEYAKIASSSSAARIERIRYRFYTIEQSVARRLGRSDRFAGVRLCVLITESACRRPWLDVAEQSILGGADCLQLREKELESGELLDRARKLATLCRRHGVLSIINDRPDIAILSAADGVHVGQHDLPAVEARKLIGPDRILGVSTHQIEQARRAVRDGADYIGVGPIFKSATKPREFVAGLDLARQVASEIHIPALAIAGITLDNVDHVLASAMSAIAVTAAVAASDDPRAAAAELKRKLSPPPA
jgi:thiamine-phosphate pyrophosphorylase